MKKILTLSSFKANAFALTFVFAQLKPRQQKQKRVQATARDNINA